MEKEHKNVCHLTSQPKSQQKLQLAIIYKNIRR